NIAGNGKYNIDGNQQWSRPEQKNLWSHLSRAGMIGPVDDAKAYYNISPPNSFGSHIGVGHITIRGDGNPVYHATLEYPARNVFFPSDFPRPENFGQMNLGNCTRIAQLDQKMDDGKPHQ